MPYFDCGRTGLVGTVGVTVLDSTGASHVARTTAGITEPVAGSGVYYVADHDAAATLTYVWDIGVGTMGAAETVDATNTLALKILRNKTVTDPATGEMTVYDDNSTTPLYTANVYEDVAGSVPYDGQAANRRDRLA